MTVLKVEVNVFGAGKNARNRATDDRCGNDLGQLTTLCDKFGSKTNEKQRCSLFRLFFCQQNQNDKCKVVPCEIGQLLRWGASRCSGVYWTAVTEVRV